jgi:hypothetical protein
MREITVKDGTSLYVKIFHSVEYDVTIFVYLDKDNNVISLNYHWGTNEINPKYLAFNGDGEATKLYHSFKKIMGSHSTKLYDLVIAANSVITKKELYCSELQFEIAKQQLISKDLAEKLNRISNLIK